MQCVDGVRRLISAHHQPQVIDAHSIGNASTFKCVLLVVRHIHSKIVCVSSSRALLFLILHPHQGADHHKPVQHERCDISDCCDECWEKSLRTHTLTLHEKHRREVKECGPCEHVHDKLKLQGTFNERLELQDMPFDRQILPVSLSNCSNA